jgi:hypothetical protein
LGDLILARRTLMKKKFLIGLMALLSLSLFFLGCPTEGDDGEVETFTTLTGYSLVTSVNNIDTIGNTSNLYIHEAKKSDKDGTIYIKIASKLGHPLAGTVDFGGTHGLWSGKREEAPAGKWADFGLDLSAIFTDEVTSNILSIKTTNEAFLYYKGATLLPNLTNGPFTTEPNIYIPATGLPVKWKLNDANAFASDKIFGLILWSGASKKTITLEVAEHASFAAGAEKTDDIAKIVIDYSSVAIQ